MPYYVHVLCGADSHGFLYTKGAEVLRTDSDLAISPPTAYPTRRAALDAVNAFLDRFPGLHFYSFRLDEVPLYCRENLPKAAKIVQKVSIELLSDGSAYDPRGGVIRGPANVTYTVYPDGAVSVFVESR